MLIKGGDVLETCHKINAIIFDKTGLLPQRLVSGDKLKSFYRYIDVRKASCHNYALSY